MAKRKGSKSHGKRKYLGTVVPDIGHDGLDSPFEVAAIMGAIMSDYRRGKIDKDTARGKLALLKLVAKRQGVWNKSLQAMLRSAMAKLRQDKKGRG